MAGYRMSKTDFLFGGAGFLINFRSSIDSTFSIRGQGTIDRRTIIPDDDGVSGFTADGLEAGVSATGTFRKTAQVDQLISNPSGFLVIRRRDANYAYVYPMNLDSDGSQIPALAAITTSLSWSPSDENYPVAGVPVVGRDLAVAGGSVGYVIKAASILQVPSGGSLPVGANEFGVAGPILDAE